MTLLELNKNIKERHYLMANANSVDLKYLYLPSIEIPDDYLEMLSYVDANDTIALDKISTKAFEYHRDRTERNQAHRIKEREKRKLERDNDPFYWLAIYLKAQSQLLISFGHHYKNSGVTTIKNQKLITEKIELMDQALKKLKSCKINGQLVKVKEYPSLIKIERDKIVTPTPKEKEVEDKYLAFCKKYNIDIKLVAETRVFDLSGAEYTKEHVARQIKECEEARQISLNAIGKAMMNNTSIMHADVMVLENVKKDSWRTFYYYSRFMESRQQLRNLIGRFFTAGMDEGLTKSQLEQLNKAVSRSSEDYRNLTMSKHYTVGFAVSSQKDFDTISYSSSKLDLNADSQNSKDIDADDMLLQMYNKAKELQEKMELAKRKKSSIASRIEEINHSREQLTKEEDQLTIQGNELDADVNLWENEYNDIMEKLGKRK